MASVLVTGGAGFLGSLLVAKLLNDGHNVASIDLLPSTASHLRLRPVVGDLRDRDGMRALLAAARPEVVFHCAALLAHDTIDKRELWSSNVGGTAVLADAMVEAGIRKIVLSAATAYGGGVLTGRLPRIRFPAPIELYGHSKWEGEKILLGQPGLNVTVIRCPTIIDEGRLGLLAILFEFIADGRRVWTVGAGSNRYQFIYAADLIDAMLKSWHASSGGVYGIGADNVTTMRETFAHVIAASGNARCWVNCRKRPHWRRCG